MENNLVDLIRLLPERLSADENLRLRILALSTKASVSWWKPLMFDENYRLLRDLVKLHDHYLEKRPLENWKPSSEEMRKNWKKPRDWDETAWREINASHLVRNNQRFWALALTYTDISQRRAATLKWILATLFAALTVAAAIIGAVAKAGIR